MKTSINPVVLEQQIVSLVTEHCGAPAVGFRDELRHLVKQASQFARGEVSHEVTILLSDIRGFTAISEHHSAQDTLRMLNHYFSRMNQIIQQYDGVIDKYMGDAVMVVFGFGGDQENAPYNATACAIDMQNAMDEVNRYNDSVGFPRIYTGIGINTGIVSSGQLGSDIHREFSVIGDGVNLASRIEPHSLRGQILISGHTHERIRDHVLTDGINRVNVKGKTEPVTLYNVVGLNWKGAKLEVPRREPRNSIRVKLQSPFSFHPLQGKQVMADPIRGTTQDISYSGLSAITNQAVKPMTDIKFSLALSLLGGETREIYAKVISIRELDEGFGCGIEFTAIDDESQQSIKAYVDKMIQRK